MPVSCGSAPVFSQVRYFAAENGWNKFQEEGMHYQKIHSTWCETFLSLWDSPTVSPAHPHAESPEDQNLFYKGKLDHDKST